MRVTTRKIFPDGDCMNVLLLIPKYKSFFCLCNDSVMNADSAAVRRSAAGVVVLNYRDKQIYRYS